MSQMTETTMAYAIQTDGRGWTRGPAVTDVPSTDLTCVHAARGLCEQCRRDYAEDPQGWIEFGNHTAGLARWRALEAEMREWAERAYGRPAPPPDDPSIPF